MYEKFSNTDTKKKNFEKIVPEITSTSHVLYSDYMLFLHTISRRPKTDLSEPTRLLKASVTL